MAASSKQNSRFSSLKVFKFAGSRAENSSKPPPLPPKDPYYLNNRSLASLSPDSVSLPSTPLSPEFVRRPSPVPSQSTMSLLSFAPSISPSTSESTATSQKKGFFKFGSLGRRTPKSMSPTSLSPEPESLHPPEPTDDEGISLPWNFQHTIHVDEGYNGIPPSWSLQLSNAGFTEDEIAAIHSRRRIARSPSSANMYRERPQSPAASSAILACPHPRTSSLPRQYSNGSIASSYRQSSQYIPPVPPLPAGVSRSGTLRRQFSNVSREFSDASSSSLDRANSDVQYVFVNRDNGNSTPSEPASLPLSLPDREESLSVPDVRPRTPPRRQFHVMNQTSPGSPPPAYRSPELSTGFPRGKEGARTSERDLESPPPLALSHTLPVSGQNESVDDDDTGNSTIIHEHSRLRISPPRISFQFEGTGDMSSWTESLFSAIPSAVETSTPSPTPSLSSSSTSNTSPYSTLSLSHSSPSLLSLSLTPAVAPLSNPSSAPSSFPPRRYPQQKPFPSAIPILEQVSEETRLTLPTTPLWEEVMSLVRPNPTPTASSSPGLPTPETPFTPALTDANSPILPPPTPPSKEQFTKPQVPTVIEHSAEEHDEEVSTLLPPAQDLERDSNRDSGLSTISAVTVTAATIVTNATIATRAVANVIESPTVPSDKVKQGIAFLTKPLAPTSPLADKKPKQVSKESKPVRVMSGWVGVAKPMPLPPPPPRKPTSPQSSDSGCDSGSSSSGSGSMPRSATGSMFERTKAQSPVTEEEPMSEEIITQEVDEKAPSPVKEDFLTVSSVHAEEEEEKEEEGNDDDDTMQRPPSIIVTPVTADAKATLSTNVSPSTTASTPITPGFRFRGWQSEVLAQLEEFITHSVDPRSLYVDLQEIAEGDSGSVYAARVVAPDATPVVTSLVAVKQVAILPGGSQKLVDLQRELAMMREMAHENVLRMDALFVDYIDDALWIRMELMERSLADVVGLVEDGLMLQERMIARFASDVLLALDYLQQQLIAHRDVRSDNLLLNSSGVLKLADFSNAVQVTADSSIRSEPVGVIYWQAPEMRSGLYDVLKVDVWSVGATVWEMAQAEPPFADVDDVRQIGDQWPSLNQPEIYSRSFHEFLRLCSQPSSSRSSPSVLLNTPFIQNACGRAVIVQLLLQCRHIEENMLKHTSAESQSTVYS